MKNTKTYLNIVILLICVFSAVLFFTESVPAAVKAIKVKVNESKIISGRNIQRVAVVNPEILDVAVLSEKELFILGKVPGETKLNIWSDSKLVSYQVIVSESTEELKKKIKEALGKNDIDIIVVKNTVILKGTVKNEESITLAGKIAAIYFENVENLLKIDYRQKHSRIRRSSKTRTQSDEIQELIGLKNISVYSKNGAVILDGIIRSDDERKRALDVAGIYSKNVIDLMKLSEPSQILIEAKIVEIEKDETEDMGVEWSGSSGAQGQLNYQEKIRNTIGELNSESLLAKMNPFKIGEIMRSDSINLKLQALLDTNKAKLISSPKLLTMNNEQAVLNVGGQVPISTVSTVDGNQTTSITWRDWGIIMDILPTIDNDNNITMKVDTEVSSLGQIYNVSGSEVPSITTKRASTKVCVKQGTMIVISGLINKEVRKNVSRIPVLSDIPGIGKIFRKVSEQEKEKELLIFLTPYIVNTKGDMLKYSRSSVQTARK